MRSGPKRRSLLLSTPTVFKFPLELSLQTGTTTKRDVVEVTEREQSFIFRLEARPTAVTLDPDVWLLKG